MAKQKAKAKGNQPRVKKGQIRNVPRYPGLDQGAANYAKLLANPCTSPLVHPVYAGSDGGLLARFECDSVILTGATTTAGAFFWCPGGIGNTGGGASATVLLESTGSNTAATATRGAGNTQQPGWAFLNANAEGVRCIAACLQVYWIGTEANRQGYVTYGLASGSSIVAGDSVAPDNFATLFPKSARMPEDMIEFRWRPSDADQMYTDPALATPQIEVNRKTGLGIVFKGIPGTTGIRVRQIAVYEYIPNINSGLTAGMTSRGMSNNSLTDVVNALDRMGDWLYGAAAVAGKLYRGSMQVAPYVRAVGYAATKAAPMIGW